MKEPKAAPVGALLWPYVVAGGRLLIGVAARSWTFIKSYPTLLTFAGITAIIRSQINDFFDLFTNPDRKDSQGAKASAGIIGFYSLIILSLVFLGGWLFRKRR